MEHADLSSSSSTCPLFQRQSTKRSFSAMENSHHRSSSPDSLFVPHGPYQHNTHHQPMRTNSGLTLPSFLPLGRSAAYGFDFRRPIMSPGGGASVPQAAAAAASAAVIDLTEDGDARDGGSDQPDPPHFEEAEVAGGGGMPAQRLPRYGRDIIDLNSEEEDSLEASSGSPSMTDFLPPHEPPREGLYNHHHRHQHPRYSQLRRPQRSQPSNAYTEDLLIDERRSSRPQTVSRTHTPTAPAQRSVTPYPTGLDSTIDLTGEDDEVVHVESRTRLRTDLERPTTTAGVGTRSVQDDFPLFERFEIPGRLLQRIGGLAGRAGFRAQQDALDDLNHNRHRHIGTDLDFPQLQFAVPPSRVGGAITMLDYGTVAFDMGLLGGNRPPSPKYEPPELPKPGFTRSPAEDEVVVCPNCGDELAMGESKEKQEVWVIKKCGHAYCGDCARNRARTGKSSKKGKGKAVAFQPGPLPFKTCVVDGCKESASKQSMVYVYFGS